MNKHAFRGTGRNAGTRTFLLNHTPWLVIALLLAMLIGPQTTVAKSPLADISDLGRLSSGKQNMLFLPFRVSAPEDATGLASKADQALETVLIEQGHAMYPRALAEEKVNYKAAWPLPPEKIRNFPTQAGINYVAAGNLSQVGSRISIDLVVYDLLESGKPAYFFASADSIQELGVITRKVVNEALGFSGRFFNVASVEIHGNKRIDTGAILKHVTSKAGDRYDPNQLRRDLKEVFKLGYFEDVKLSVQETEKGKQVVFDVVEKDVIDKVSITGNNKIDESDIREVLGVTPNSIISVKQTQAAVSNIKKLYKEKGFYNTEIQTELTHPKEGHVDVEFAITEGTKVYIKEIRFVGNQEMKDSSLRKAIETSEKGIFSWFTDSGVLKREIAVQDASRIMAFYHNNGYVDARVSEPEIEQQNEWLFVTFNIIEGDRYTPGSLDITGDLIADKAELIALMQQPHEEYFSKEVLRGDLLRLSDYYAERGYAFAEIGPLMQKNPEKKTVDVVVSVTKGDLVYVNRIIVKGNTRTRDKVIRRELLLKEGEVFDATALKKSHQNLQRLQFFEDVSVTPEQTSEPNLMDILVDLKEKPTGTFSIGAGYSSVDNLMFMGEISQNNLLGRGQRLALKAHLGGKTTQFDLSFTEPHLSDTKLLFGVDLYDWTREFDDYTKKSKGWGLRFGYPLWYDWRLSWGYGYDQTELSDVDMANASLVILDSMDIKETSSVKVGISKDTTDRPMDPGEGGKYSLETKFAGGPLGGDSAFTKFTGSASHYWPFLFSTTLHLKGAMGYVTENSGGKLPVYEKFYLGGINTIRGFKSGHISPIDSASGDRIGGDKMWYYNSEIIFPLVKEAGLKGVVFLDAGNVMAVEDDWYFDRIKKSAGFGFRWLSPMGPLRLEWGKNLDPVGDEDTDNWDFSVGGAF